MKKTILLSGVLLLATSSEAQFANPSGALIKGAGVTQAVGFMNTLINRYNETFPCPKFIYKQTPSGVFAGLTNGINRVLEATVTFAVSDMPLDSVTISSHPDCLIQIPFALASLSIIYNLPADFVSGTLRPNANWPGHLNISPADLCSIYNTTLTWGGINGLLNRLYNGNQGYPIASPVTAFARADSAEETGLFAQYLSCSGTQCTQFAAASDPNGPFCSGSAPTWNVTSIGGNVTCVTGSDALAQSVLATPGSIGYVMSDVAAAYGFIPGGPKGIYTGVAGLFRQGSPSINNSLNYAQPMTAEVQVAMTDCNGGRLLCVAGAYPIVVGELFVLYATQPTSLIACNIAQFIQFALGQKMPGLAPLPCGCLSESLSQLDKIKAAICNPCVEPCNPCLNQTCPLPCQPCCNS